MKSRNIKCRIQKYGLIIILGMSLATIFSQIGFTQEIKNLKISGLIEVNFEDVKDEKSNLLVGDIEVSVDAKLSDKVSVNVLLRPDVPNEILDEATITLKRLSALPVTITVGKTIMPFGVFESHLISEPLTLKNWETNQVGVIVNYNKGMFKTSAALYDSSKNKDVGAVAIQLSINPRENFTASVSYKSYPEDVGETEAKTYSDISNRLTYIKGKLTLDGEYCQATKREEGKGKPSAYFLALAYQVREPLELALRYEDFDDHDETVISTNSKVSWGFNYLIARDVTLSMEYTKNKSEQDKKDKGELYVKLATKI